MTFVKVHPTQMIFITTSLILIFMYMYLLDSDDNSEVKGSEVGCICRVTFTSLELIPIQPKRFTAATVTLNLSGQSLNRREDIKELVVTATFSAGT